MSLALAHDPRVVLPENPIFPKYSAGERMADAVVHIISVAISLAAVITLMIVAWPLAEPLSIISLWVYGTGMVAVFAFSAGYHLVRRPILKEALRRLDHAAIFVMIAGSCTPFALVNIGGAYGIALLSVVWGIGLLGIALKLFLPRRFERVSIGLYLVQGWAVLAVVQPLASGVSPLVLTLLAIGGGLYTVGVAFHLCHRLSYHNAIWHTLVLVAAGCHYVAILDAVALPLP